jgi:hypothetical protein
LLTEVAGLRAVVGELRDAQAATTRIRVEAVEARVDAARAMAERDAARSTAAAEIAAMRQQLETEVAARNAVIEELMTAMEHERAERAKLAAALAEARKPLLVRVVEAIRRKGS